MIRAVAIGSVIEGDKADKAKTDMLNEDCAVDVAELGGDDATGSDALYEIKVVSPHLKKLSLGRGTKAGGGKPASVGHRFAFGNTEEIYRIKILGCRKRGRSRDDPFDHDTGRGYVEEQRGAYRDALLVKRNRVIPVIVETNGGITPQAIAHISHLARRARGKAARDSTRYGTSRTSPTSFFVHHVQAISMAARLEDARGIRREIRNEKQQLIVRSATGHP